jgi:squalene-associated FAD-dependent desaturase
MARRVALIGGGYAGMAAAVELAARGIAVSVFDAGPVLGGRARRVVTQGLEVDNGQHILVGAYTELFRLMRKVGVPDDAVLRMPLELRSFSDFHFRALWLPAPFGLLGGLLSARGIPFRERLGAARFMLRMQRQRFRLGRDVAVRELLEAHGQQHRIEQLLWRPLCTAALNTPPEEASANVFLAVLRDTLSGPREASDLLLPRVDLSRLFPEPAADFVRSRGGEVRLRARVSDMAAVREQYAAVVVAVGPHQLEALLPDVAPAYSYQPIYTCYLQYPERVRLPFPLLSLTDGLVQWAFDCGALGAARGRLACVISAKGDHQSLAHEELVAVCERELRAELGELPPSLWWRVIAEKRATFSCAPNLPRPGPETGLPGVFLAGDYTHPEYPATLEAAVRSGVRAARLVTDFLNGDRPHFSRFHSDSKYD